MGGMGEGGRGAQEGGGICRHIADSLCCIAEINTTLSCKYAPILKKSFKILPHVCFHEKLLEEDLHQSKTVKQRRHEILEEEGLFLFQRKVLQGKPRQEGCRGHRRGQSKSNGARGWGPKGMVSRKNSTIQSSSGFV